MKHNFRRWLGKMGCALALLVAWQLALAATPCMNRVADEIAAIGAGCAMPAGSSLVCTGTGTAAGLCAAKAWGAEAAAIHSTPSDSPPFAGPRMASMPVAGPHRHGARTRRVTPGHSPPVHIRLGRFLS